MEDKELVNLAILDEERLLIGYEFGEASTANARRIIVPKDCDLVPELYRWNKEVERFDPILPIDVIPEDHPDALYAIAAGFSYLINQGIELPKATLEWLSYYRTTIDYNIRDNKS